MGSSLLLTLGKMGSSLLLTLRSEMGSSLLLTLEYKIRDWVGEGGKIVDVVDYVE